MSCECCGTGVLEIKCPYSCKEKSILETSAGILAKRNLLRSLPLRESVDTASRIAFQEEKSVSSDSKAADEPEIGQPLKDHKVKNGCLHRLEMSYIPLLESCREGARR